MHEYGITVVNELPNSSELEVETHPISNTQHSTPNYSAAILAVAHKEFSSLNIRDLVDGGIVFDVKGVLPKEVVDARL